jgi:hypothetical protein
VDHGGIEKLSNTLRRSGMSWFITKRSREPIGCIPPVDFEKLY